MMQAFLRRLRALGAIRELSGAQINFPTEALLCRAIILTDPFGANPRATRSALSLFEGPAGGKDQGYARWLADLDASVEVSFGYV